MIRDRKTSLMARLLSSAGIRRHPVRYTLLIPILTGRKPRSVETERMTRPYGPVIRNTNDVTRTMHTLFRRMVSILLMITDIIFPHIMVDA